MTAESKSLCASPDSDAAESSIQCAAYIGNGRRCPNQGLRKHDEMVDADGTGRTVWLSWCDFHYHWNEARRGSSSAPIFYPGHERQTWLNAR